MPLHIALIRPSAAHLYGATLAQEHLSLATEDWSASTREDTVLMLDLDPVMSITPSYLKATMLWALQCGQAEVQQRQPTASSTPGSVRPLKLFPVVTGCSSDVAADVHEFFLGRGLPILHVTTSVVDRLISGQILGALDPLLVRTFETLVRVGKGTAADLASASGENISLNGWNNRLADLYLLRLVTRRRMGKFWVYAPLVERISPWA